jgi:hypothetical protein
MVESGLGVLAACLPTQYALFGSTGLQSIVNSVRSAISLHSIRSATQNISANGSGYMRSEIDPWASDTQRITTNAERSSVEDSKLEAQYEMKEGILVTHNFQFDQETTSSSRKLQAADEL